METVLWAEAAGTVLATLETALLGEDPEGAAGASALLAAAAAAAAASSSSRKHARRTNSDTVSDIEMPGSPVKRRRESVGSGSASDDVPRPTAKSRRIASALTSRFARSLSVHGGDGGGGDGTGAARSPACSSGSLSSSSSSSLSSASPICPTPLLGLGGPAQSSGMAVDAAPAGVCGQRAMRLPAANRSARAREKVPARPGGMAAGLSQSSMDTDPADPQAPRPGSSSSHSGGGTETSENAFALLLQAGPPVAAAGSVGAAMEEWALGQARETGQAPAELFEAASQRVGRLGELVPAVLEGTSRLGQHQAAGDVGGEQLRGLHQAALEAAEIGEWLCRRRFGLLAAALPTLHRALPQLSAAIRVARISEDMRRLVQWAPAEPALAVAEMGAAYEELVHAKRALYGDMLAQDGLTWRAMGVPVDSALLLRVRQCLVAITEQCLTHVARECGQRAAQRDAGAAAPDALLHIAHQVLHAAAQCAALCGDSFADLAPCVMFIVAECAARAAKKPAARPLPQSAGAPSRGAQPARPRGRQLESRALRQAQECEGLLKLLAYARAILAADGASLAAALRGCYADPTTADACRSLAASLVDLSWSLAETLAALRADGRTTNPSGPSLLFMDLVVKFGRRVADLGGSRAAQSPAAQARLRRMQGFVRSLDPLRQIM
ncbi:hypothetical protein H4R18_005092 [Coemansia javaensis]|uniref:Uncharacterized protein n=1 Tax=Coemansia javaensis TaxID=2761396 RepID=A0A9W8H633_9FUNG|nr:hypothetical protein H4R18_005092 [Coemansia javaensis]